MSSDFDTISTPNRDPNSDPTLQTELDGGDDIEELAATYGNLPFEDVEIKTDKAEGRQRQISATIRLPYSTESVWQILTDYDHLADFIPNLTKSCRIDHPHGGIRIEQIGTESLLKLKFCARVVLDMVEHFPHRLDFNMVEGDFKLFAGSWLLQPIDVSGNTGTELCYTVSILPPRIMPVNMIERRLSKGLIVNLSAIRQRADMLFGT